MNTQGFREFIETLESLPRYIQYRHVEHLGTDERGCNMYGYFAHVIRIVITNIYELKNSCESCRCYHVRCKSLLKVLLKCDFEQWVRDNPILWGMRSFDFEFHNARPFCKDPYDTLRVIDISRHLRNVYNRWVEFEKKTNNKGEIK